MAGHSFSGTARKLWQPGPGDTAEGPHGVEPQPFSAPAMENGFSGANSGGAATGVHCFQVAPVTFQMSIAGRERYAQFWAVPATAQLSGGPSRPLFARGGPPPRVTTPSERQSPGSSTIPTKRRRRSSESYTRIQNRPVSSWQR